MVAPYLGAWIEIFTLSHFAQLFNVAPYLGAWIEMLCLNHQRKANRRVAPYLGAWIEIT